MAGITAEAIHRAFLAATTPRPVPHIVLDHVAPIRVSVAEAVGELIDELPRVGSITFRRLTAELADRLSVIVRFLAILELYKQGAVELEQAANFGELTVVWLGFDAEEGAASAAVVVGVDEYQG
jgi:segregation and condensation protein A